MPPVYTKEVSGAQLVSGIVGTIGLESIIRAGIGVAVAGRELPGFKNTFSTEFWKWKDYLKNWALDKPEIVVGRAPGWFETTSKILFDNIYQTGKNAEASGILGSLWSRYTGELMNLMGRDIAEELAIGKIKDVILEKGERYWNKYFGIGRPKGKELYIMYRKNLIDYQFLLDAIREDFGFSKELAEKYIEHLDYDPGLFDLARIIRTFPPPEEWLERKLKSIGIGDEDKAIIKTWLKMESIKDELTSIVRYLYSEYQSGFISSGDLEKVITQIPSSKEEISLKITNAQIMRDIYRKKLLRDKFIYLYRNGKLTEDGLYERLKTVVEDDVANCITQLEAAKKGVDWAK